MEDSHLLRIHPRPHPYRTTAASDELHESDVRYLDRALVRRAQEGDREAFERLYRTHHAAVFRKARFSLGVGGSEAEDVTAETFARAWRGLSRYQDDGSAPFVSWLIGIAQHVVTDEHRRRVRTEPRAELPEWGIDTSPDNRLALAEALERLPDEQRQVIELKFFAGLTNEEVAEAMGTTSGAVNAKQWRGLRALQDLLGER